MTVKRSACTIEIPTNIPRLLLRRYYGESTTTTTKFRFVFCPFRECLEAVRAGIALPSSGGRFEILLRNSVNLYGFERKILDALLNDARYYCVLYTLLYRLHHCHRLAFKSRELPRIVYHLQLLIDTHIDLCGYMLRNESYRDELLLDPDLNSDHLVQDALTQYEPHDWRVMHGGELPDLTPCIDMGNVWYDVRPKPRIDNIICALIHIVACKTQSHKCQLRNFMRILHGYLQKYPAMIELFRMFLEVSMLGNYPESRYRPRFEKRIAIRYSFRTKALLDNHYLFLWMLENDQFVHYATKEMYVFMVESQYALDCMMDETGYWPEIKRNIWNAMDMARNALCADHSWDRKNGFTETLDRDLKQIHQDMLPFISKLRKSGFLEIMIQEMNKFHEKNVVNKRSPAVQTSDMLLAKYLPETDLLQLLSDMQLIVDAEFSERRQNSLPLKWLKCFRVSECGYDVIRTLYFDYECRDIADNSIGRRIGDMYEVNQYDFHVIRLFFEMINERCSYAEFRLSADYVRNQTNALVSKYCVAPWEELPETSDLFYYCSVCKKWLNPVIDSLTKKNRLNQYAQGCEKALYDQDTDTLYCGKQNTSVNIRKLIESKLYYEERELDDQAAARNIRRHKETSRCCDTPLRSVHMLGICKRLGKKLWALCEVCGGLTQWEGAKFGKLGFTCGNHGSGARTEETTHVSLRQWESIELQLEDNSWDQIKEEFNTTTTLNSCYYCGTDLSTRAFTKVVRILEDDDMQKFRYVDARLCEGDYDKCRNIFKYNIITRKSMLHKVIGKNRFREGTKVHIKKPRKVF